jgi:hypothetical protein
LCVCFCTYRREGGAPTAFNAAEFDTLCELISNTDAEPEDRATAMKDVEGLMEDVECQQALLQKPEIVESLVEVLFSTPETTEAEDKVSSTSSF